MRPAEAELEFHRNVEKAMLNAWKNGLSKEQVRFNLVALARSIEADDELGAQLISLGEKLYREAYPVPHKSKPPEAA